MSLSARVRSAVRRVVGPRPAAVRFVGGTNSRLVAGWFAELQSINDRMQFSLATLRARSRSLVEDNGEAAGLLMDFESDIVGAHGARLQFRALTPRGKPRDPLNDRVEAAWRRWSKRDRCTVAGDHSFASVQRLVMRSVVCDGEFLALRVRDASLPFGYQLQPIDPDQLDDTYNVSAAGVGVDGVSIVMGVEVDRRGKPLAYHVWDRHPSDSARRRERVPADRVLHVFKRLRPGQVRGVPWFAPALIAWKLGDRYTEAELYQSLLAAAQGGFFVNRDGTAPVATPTRRNPDTGLEEPIPIDMQAAPGEARQLPAGWEFQSWSPTHPTANYVGFMQAVKRGIARAFGRSYASLTGDLSQVNFSSMRIDRVREIEQNKLHQADLIVAQCCDVVFADWVRMASITGALGVVPVDADALVGFAHWMGKGWPWIDPLKDMAAAELELKHALISRQELCAMKGRDFWEVVDALAEEAEYARAKGVTLGDVDAAVTAAPASPTPATSDDDLDDDEADEALDDTDDRTLTRPPRRARWSVSV
jgi:lambda family phage portal protein